MVVWNKQGSIPTIQLRTQVWNKQPMYSVYLVYLYRIMRPCQGGGGGPRSLDGILKCLVSAFCQGFTSLSEIERHTFVLVRRLFLFHLGAVTTFWPMSLVGIYPGRASIMSRINPGWFTEILCRLKNSFFLFFIFYILLN